MPPPVPTSPAGTPPPPPSSWPLPQRFPNSNQRRRCSAAICHHRVRDYCTSAASETVHYGNGLQLLNVSCFIFRIDLLFVISPWPFSLGTGGQLARENAREWEKLERYEDRTNVTRRRARTRTEDASMRYESVMIISFK